MTDTATSTIDPPEQLATDPPDVETLAERLFAGAIASIELGTIHLGLQLGLYRALEELGAATPAELAKHADIDARYAREWLEQQAVAQLVTCPNTSAAAEERVYELPGATAVVLLDPSTPAYLGPLAHLAVGTMRVAPELERAFRTGEGVAFERYGAEVRHGLAALNGATYDRELAGWLAATPDLDRRLRERERPRILDLGSGTGRSTLALARAYPRAEVRGVDLDRVSVEEARRAAAEAGLANRVTFAFGDAASDAVDGTDDRPFDLVTIFEALHDMGDPVGALASARASLDDGGAVLVADQLTRDAFAADGDAMERFQYGCSVLHCLPATRAEDPVIAHGTVIRAATVEAWARLAGFSGAHVLDIEDPFWRFYLLA